LQDRKKKIIGIALAVFIFLVYFSVATYAFVKTEDEELFDLLTAFPLFLAMVLWWAWKLFKESESPTLFPVDPDISGCMVGCLFVVFVVLFVVWLCSLVSKLISKLVGQ